MDILCSRCKDKIETTDGIFFNIFGTSGLFHENCIINDKKHDPIRIFPCAADPSNFDNSIAYEEDLEKVQLISTNEHLQLAEVQLARQIAQIEELQNSIKNLLTEQNNGIPKSPVTDPATTTSSTEEDDLKQLKKISTIQLQKTLRIRVHTYRAEASKQFELVNKIKMSKDELRKLRPKNKC